LSPIIEFRPPPFHIYRRFSWSCTSHLSTSHLHPTKITHDLFPPRTPRSARTRVAVASLAALMLNVYSSWPAHASQKILVSTAGNPFIANPAISNPDAVSSCTRNLGVKSEPHHLYAAHGTAHTSPPWELLPRLGVSGFKAGLKTADCREYQGLLCPRCRINHQAHPQSHDSHPASR
jgi:hypothetical protein